MENTASEVQRTVGRLGGLQGLGCTGDHLVATSNLSLTRLTLQALAPCFFLSVSQSSDVSKRGTGGFLELWPRAGVRHRGGEPRQLLSSSIRLSPLPSPRSPLTHPLHSGLSLRTAGLDCFELWPGRWPWSPVEERTFHAFWLRRK